MVSKVIKDYLSKDLKSIDFSGNRLDSLGHFERFNQAAPNLLNLNFDTNSIKTLDELDHLKEFKNLQELIITRNPVVDELDEATIKREVLRKFPNINVLNMQPVQNFSVPEAAVDDDNSGLPPPGPSFIQDSITQVLTALINQYFDQYDKNRSSLLDFYVEDAVFSHTCIKGHQHGDFFANNRNFVDVMDKNNAQDFKRSLEQIVRGRNAIIDRLNQFPATSHNLGSFVVDSWEESDPFGAMLVFIHGEFLDYSKKMNRRFDRTFVLIPARAGSLASQKGYPAEILSDHLRLKSSERSTDSKRPATFNASQVSSAAARSAARSAAEAAAATSSSNTASSTLITQPGGAVPLTPEDELLVKRLMEATKLNHESSVKMLMLSTGNLELAIQTVFKLQQAGEIPPSAFIQ